MSDVFRQEYKELNGYVKDTIYLFKARAENLLHEFNIAEDAEADLCEVDKRCMALAKTNLEQAVMWAVKAIT